METPASPKKRFDCKVCKQSFRHKSSLVRHVKRCTQSPTQIVRQKACIKCSAAKVRCDLQKPKCSRCLGRGLSCKYIAPVSGASGAARSSPPSTTAGSSSTSTSTSNSTPESSDVPFFTPGQRQELGSNVAANCSGSTGPSDAIFPQVPTVPDDFQLDPLTDMLLPPALDHPNANNMHDVFPNMDATHCSEMACIPISDYTAKEGDTTTPNSFSTEELGTISDELALSLLPMETPTAALTNHSMVLLLRVIRSWPRMMAEGFQSPPFLHPSQLSATNTPLPLANCLTMTKMWDGQCEGSSALIRATVETEMEEIFKRYRTFSEINRVAALQAMVIYTVILLFPSKTQTTISPVDNAVFVKLRRFLVFMANTGVVLQEERDGVRPPLWPAWIHVASKRRCLVTLYLLHWCYAVWSGTPSYCCKDLGPLPAPSPKFLWQASSAEQWETLYNRWLAKWDGECFMQAEFDEIGREVVMDRRAEMWFQEADEFGVLMMSIVNATRRDAVFMMD